MPHVQIARKTWATCPPRSQGRCHNFGIIKTCQKMDCIAQIVNSSKLCVNFSHRIRMDSIQSMFSDLDFIQITRDKTFFNFAMDPNIKFRSFWPFWLWPQVHSESWRHATTLAFDFGHMSTHLWYYYQNYGNLFSCTAVSQVCTHTQPSGFDNNKY